MRSFIVLCFMAVAFGEQSGYNYQPSSIASPSYGGPISSVSASYGSQSVGDSYGSPSYGSPSYAPQAELAKEFYTYTANDDDFVDPAASQQVTNSLKQALRVIFIKGPENHALEDAALNLAKSTSEQHTDIYVLNKQPDLADLANKLNNENKFVNHKPEVHFVKYRTPEDAANAQKAIQSQYDSLGGRSQHIDGGVAPSLNFASQAPIRIPSASVPQNKYLPASVLRN